MSLKLHFIARARLWAEVVNTAGDRVFVPTPMDHRIGEIVSVDVEAPELKEPLSLTGTVLGNRPASAKHPSGVFLRIDDASVDRCASAVGAKKDQAVRVQGRTEPRVECRLSARVLSPAVMEGCEARNLSSHGLTLHSSAPVLKDVSLGLQLHLPTGEDTMFTAKVMWSSPETQLAGLRIISIDPAGAKLLDETVDLLRSGTTMRTNITVVVADDDPSILDFLSRLVAKAGHRVVRADRGDTALTLIRTEKPRLAFLDVLMPGIDGLEVCRAVRADASLAGMHLVLLSAMGESKLATAATEARASDFLSKPMRLEAVRMLLAKYVG